MLATIALIAGIADFELLLLIYVLGAACMLMGLGAEYCLRIYHSLKMLSSEKMSMPANIKKIVVDVIVPQLRGAFWILHLFAWVCIIVPWYIIYKHYMAWWEMCTTPNTKGEDVKPSPPEFVKAIVWMQIVLFFLFGLVQLIQYRYPHKRRLAEVAYIILSLTAKVMLGSMLAANVLFV